MSVVWCDGFDKYASAIATVPGSMINKYTLGVALLVSNYITRTGRNSGMCLQLLTTSSSLMFAPTTATSTWTAGFALKMASFSSSPTIISFRDGTTGVDTQILLSTNSSGFLQAYRGSFGTLLGTSGTAMAANVWSYVEIRTKIAATAAAGGMVDVNLNGTNVISFTGQTQSTLNSTALNVFMTGDATNLPNYDDFYVKNDNSSFLGDSKVETLVPSADGFYSQFSATPGPAHFSAVNEVPPDDDTSYISATVAPKIDSYTFPSLSVLTGSIYAVQWSMRAKKLYGASSHPIQGMVRSSGGTDGFSDQNSLLSDTSYAVKTSCRDTNPVTAVAWTVSDVNTSQFGVKLVS